MDQEVRLRHADIDDEARARIDAMALIELGARAPLVCRVTGLPKAMAKRLYRRVHGRHSPGGQAPFTDTWYLQSRERMLHANVVWGWHKALQTLKRPAAQHLVKLYQLYRLTVGRPLLDLEHVELIPRLVTAGTWQPHACGICHNGYISPGDDGSNLCPGCDLQRTYRCPSCNFALKPHHVGRRAERCPQCGKHLRP